MVAANFPQALARTLTYEGGNDDDPRDPGGRTSRGITQREYNSWRAKRGQVARDVWTASNDEVAIIYREDYWSRGRCESLPAGVDFVTFDANVNSGLGKGARWLQQALNDKGAKVKVDDWVGSETVHAAQSVSDKPAIVRAECARRSSFLHGLKNWSVYGKGWGRRVADVEAYGVKLALVGAGKTPDEVNTELKKAGKKAETGKVADQTAAGGAAAGGGAAGTQFDQWAGLPNWVIVAGIVAALAVAAYFLIQSRTNSQRAAAYKAVATPPKAT